MVAIWEQKNDLRRSIVEATSRRFEAAGDSEKLDMWRAAIYLLATTKSLKELKEWYSQFTEGSSHEKHGQS